MNINFNQRGSAEVRQLKLNMSRKKDIFPVSNRSTRGSRDVHLPPILKRPAATPKDRRTPDAKASYHDQIRKIGPTKVGSVIVNKRLSVESLPNISMPMTRFSVYSNSGKITTMQGHAMNVPLRSVVWTQRKLVELLMHMYHLKDHQLVRNILVYSKSLVKKNTSAVDRAVFTAQMIKAFGISDEMIIERIFTSRAFTWKNCLRYEEYAGIVCSFITENKFIQASFAFEVYDHSRNNLIDSHELDKLLWPCVDKVKDEFGQDVDRDDAVEEIKSIVLGLFGIGGKQPSCISRDLWLAHVIPRMELAQCLGQCLPSTAKLRAFMDTVRNKRAIDVSTHYRLERYECLGRFSPRSKTKAQELYPVVLEYEEEYHLRQGQIKYLN